MAPAYSWFLAVRYLLARWVNVLGMAGVAVAVWALIIVISVFSGFIHEIREHIRGATADLVLTGVAEDASYEELGALLVDPDVVATAPRLQHYAILFPYGNRFRYARKRLQITAATGTSRLQNNFVSIIGVDPALEAKTTGFRGWLDDMPPLRRIEDLERPLDVTPALYTEAMEEAGLDAPDGPMLSTLPGFIISLRRMTSGERVDRGQLVDVVTARFQRDLDAPDPEDRERVLKIRERVIVTGAYETQYRAFDEVNAFVHIDVLRGMLGDDPDVLGSIDKVTEVAIRVHPDAKLEAVQARLTKRLSDQKVGGVIKTWEEQNSVFLAAVDHERGMMKVVLFAVMLVAAFLIYATLHMMVMQKVKDIGILTSLGATPSGIAAIFLGCGTVVAAIGCSAGAVLGFLSAHYLNDVNDWANAKFGVALFPTHLYDLDRIPYRIEPEWVLQVLLAAFALSLVVAFFPALRAARMDPVKALSYE